MFQGTQPGALLPVRLAAQMICPAGFLTACRAFDIFSLETSFEYSSEKRVMPFWKYVSYVQASLMSPLTPSTVRKDVCPRSSVRSPPSTLRRPKVTLTMLGFAAFCPPGQFNPLAPNSAALRYGLLQLI